MSENHGVWRFYERKVFGRAPRVLTWHYVRDGEEQSACGSYSIGVLSREAVGYDEATLRAACRSSGHAICQRCVDRLNRANAVIRCH